MEQLKGHSHVPDPEAATLDEQAELRAALLAALKLLAEMQRNRAIAPAYKRDVERVLSSAAAGSVLNTPALAR